MRGYETWSVTLREELRLRVVENRVLREIFGPKRNELTGGGRDDMVVIFVILYTLPNIRVIKSRIMRWAGRVEERYVCVHGLLEKSEGKRPLGIPRRRWENDIKLYLKKVEWVPWTGLIWLRGSWGVSYACDTELSVSRKRRVIFCLAEDVLASQEGLYSIESVS